MNNDSIIQKIKDGVVLVLAVLISLMIYFIEKIKSKNKK